MTPDAARASIEAIPRATLELVSGGHAPWLDQIARASDSICGFLSNPP
jgi:hypothetical protein